MRQFETQRVHWGLAEQLQRCDLTPDDLVIPLRAFGVDVSVDQARALATTPGPTGIDFALLAGLCHVLRCDAGDLIDGPRCRPIAPLSAATEPGSDTVTLETGPHTWLPEILETAPTALVQMHRGSVAAD